MIAFIDRHREDKRAIRTVGSDVAEPSIGRLVG